MKEITQPPKQPRQTRDERDAEYLSNLKIVSRHMRPATRDEYRNWLSLYRARGGRPGNHRHMTFATANTDACHRVHYYVATNSFEMKPFCGANSFKIIVPDGIMIAGELGHCCLLHHDGSTSPGADIWEYSDV